MRIIFSPYPHLLSKVHTPEDRYHHSHSTAVKGAQHCWTAGFNTGVVQQLETCFSTVPCFLCSHRPSSYIPSTVAMGQSGW